MAEGRKYRFPEDALEKEELFRQMEAYKERDLNWQQGKSFCLIYYPGKEKAEMIRKAYNMFFTENALNPISFPSLKNFESEVVSMTADLMNGDEKVAGSMTGGGTESILMAVKSAREYFKKVRKKTGIPEVILPATAHPAFQKACHYFGLKAVAVPVGNDFKADVQAMSAAITRNTALIVASAPSYPQGLIDPIEEISEVARKQKILCHVDSCIGGFMLPFIKKLGYPVPAFDFALPGVTSMSVDIHKYGYSAKGASVILYRNAEIRKHQFFVYTSWSGGIYGSSAISGSRPGGSIAAAWAAIKGIGEKGYLDLAKGTMDTTDRLKEGIARIRELRLMGKPEMSIIAFTSDSVNIYEIADELNLKGWHFERLQKPAGIHLTVSQIHGDVADAFLADLKQAVEDAKQINLNKVKSNIQIAVAKRLIKLLPAGILTKLQAQFSGSSALTSDRTAPMYGMMGAISRTEDLDEIVLDILDKIHRAE